MTTHKALKERFAALPDRITREEIAGATFRKVTGVQNWINAYEDFPPVVGKRERSGVRERDAVLVWLLEHENLLQERRPGPRNLTGQVRSARPGRVVTVVDLTSVLGVNRAAVTHYAKTAPEGSADPFPPYTERGRQSVRSWPAVRSWLLRRDDPLPQGDTSWEDLQKWLLAVYEVDKDDESLGHDEHGLTVAQRDVLERVRVAKAARRRVPAEWAAEVLGLSGPKDVARLLAAPVAPAPLAEHLGPAALAREVGISERSLDGYARRYPAGCADPFPAKGDDGLRSVADVRAWLARTGSLVQGS
ncbi:hypothetical protein ACIQU4_28675 [Streptomyces sp. NPDC090741]|uniref:hypothetical protein n=1 Tax=Streptomyces sp. NPDC090741 TaxID=3365967 RepID=UPI00380706A5